MVLAAAASAHANLVTVYQNLSEDPKAGLGYYPTPDMQCRNLNDYGIE